MSKELRYNEPWILQRADPYVYRHTDGNYYFTASVPEYDRIVLRRSKNLAGLKDAEEVTVWEKHKEGIMSEHIWAPELHYLDGKWYIYFAGGDKDDIWAIRPYVLECADADPLTGAWTEKGKMGRADEDEFSFEAFSLDATVFENKGKHYYVWAEKVGVGKQISNLYIGEMETGIAYCMGMLTADENADLLDPKSWTKERCPVLCTDESKDIYGPGHNSFTVDEEGNPIMVYHARTEAEIVGDPLYNPNRHAMLMKIRWDEKTGAPVFSYEAQ